MRRVFAWFVRLKPFGLYREGPRPFVWAPQAVGHFAHVHITLSDGYPGGFPSDRLVEAYLTADERKDH